MTVAEIENATNPSRQSSAAGTDASQPWARRQFAARTSRKRQSPPLRSRTARGSRRCASPAAFPRINANIDAVSATTIKAVPAQSARLPVGSRDSRGRAVPTTNAATPIGRLTKKIACQPSVSVSSPPTSGPIALAPPSVRAECAERPRQKDSRELGTKQRSGGREEHRAADSL